MAFFRLNSNSVITLGGTAIANVTSVDINEQADDFISQSMDNTSKQHVIGLTNITGTINFEFETDAVTELAVIEVGDSGAFVLQPNGAVSGDIDIDSTNATIMSRSLSMSSGALSTGSASILFDDLTIAANA